MVWHNSCAAAHEPSAYGALAVVGRGAGREAVSGVIDGPPPHELVEAAECLSCLQMEVAFGGGKEVGQRRVVLVAGPSKAKALLGLFMACSALLWKELGTQQRSCKLLPPGEPRYCATEYGQLCCGSSSSNSAGHVCFSTASTSALAGRLHCAVLPTHDKNSELARLAAAYIAVIDGKADLQGRSGEDTAGASTTPAAGAAAASGAAAAGGPASVPAQECGTSSCDDAAAGAAAAGAARSKTAAAYAAAPGAAAVEQTPHAKQQVQPKKPKHTPIMWNPAPSKQQRTTPVRTKRKFCDQMSGGKHS